MSIVKTARIWATQVHSACNHTYDGRPYSYHLAQAAQWARRFSHLLEPDQRDIVIAGAWVHDSIEDARQTYNDVLKAVGIGPAEIAYALTNDKGKTRAERAGDAYYEGIRQNFLFVYVKLCDRLANVSNSVRTGSRMAQVYKDEYPHFRAQILGSNAPTDEDVRHVALPMLAKIKELLDL